MGLSIGLKEEIWSRQNQNAPHVGSKKEFAFHQTVEGREGAAFPHARILACVDELQRLGDKFNFPDAAPAELDVERLAFFVVQRALDPRLHLLDIFEGGEVEVTAKHKR